MYKKLLTAAVLALTGCGLQAQEYKDAVPRAEAVEMKVPGSKGQALETASSGQALEGDKAAFYTLTRGISLFVNGAGHHVLSLIRTITDHQPTRFDEDQGVAVWGPYTEALSPNTWRLTVTKLGLKHFHYALEAKAKNDPDTAFLTILAGEHTAISKTLGHGEFVLDMDAAQALPEHDPNALGKATYVYSHDADDADTVVQAEFAQVRDNDSGRLVNAIYKYISNEVTGGSLDFQFQGDVDKSAGSQLENATINSRWARDGAGRTDARVTGGDLGANVATASECWDSNFASRFLEASWDASLGYGSPSACGNLTTAQFSLLRL